MHLGKFVFAQIVEFIPRFEFDKCVKRYNGDFHARNLNSYNHLLQLIFGQITACTSLLDICLCLKQNMTVKRIWGYSENAIRTHLWIAIISYLLIAKIKAELQTPYSITEVARILGVSAFAKIPIRELLAEPQSTIENQNVKELKLF